MYVNLFKQGFDSVVIVIVHLNFILVNLVKSLMFGFSLGKNVEKLICFCYSAAKL